MNSRQTIENVSQKGIIFFDGLCRACSMEIDHYRKQKGSESFEFQDITERSFKAEDFGLDPFLVHKVMHVQDPKGNMYQGVDAFIAIWKQLPRYQKLSIWAQNPWVRKILNLGYNSFVIIRPYLPRKKDDCSDSPYCEVKK